MSNPDNTLILVDGSSYLHRAFHALPPLTTSQGQPTGAVYGLMNMLRNLIDQHQPHYVAVVFDAGGKTFRENIYPTYKANRPPPDNSLLQQINKAYELVQFLGLPLLCEPGVEADDVIGTLTQQALEEQMEVIIFTGDKDLAQLVTPQVTLVDTMKAQSLSVEGIKEKFGIPPRLIVDYLTLIGDSSDNVKGVDKVGPKTALKWLEQYGSLDDIIAHANEIKGKVGENLRSTLAQIPNIREVLTIRQDVPLSVTPKQLIRQPYQTEALIDWLTGLEFNTDWLKPNQTEKPHLQYTTIFTEEEWQTWLSRLQQADYFAFDTETTSLNYLQAKIVGLSFSLEPYQAIYIPLKHDYMGVPQQLGLEKILTDLQPLLENPHPKKIGQNLKYDAHVLQNHGINLHGILNDTLLNSYVLDSTTQHNLESLAKKQLGRTVTTFEQLAGKGKKQLTFNQINIDKAGHYAAEDAEVTLHLHHKLQTKIKRYPQLENILQTIELPLLPVLVRMERYGVNIAADKLHNHSLELATQLQSLEQQAHELAGESFNLNSPKQLQEILFKKCQLPSTKKTSTGKSSTAVEVLEELASDSPLAKVLLEYRSLSKLKSTYTDALPQQINRQTGRVHTSYHQAVTATGRLSSSDPNLQNIPIRTAEGRRIRQAFVASPGYQLLAADYSQIELRIMAHLSKDEKLLAAFANQADIHRATASEVFNVTLAEVTQEQRRSAKAVNFGLIYGMQAFGLAKQLGIDRAQAQEYIDTYFSRYPNVKDYMTASRTLAHQQGYVETVLGRRLYITDIKSKNYQRRQYAERSAINAPMQGTAADIIKLAMIALETWIQDSQLDIRMLMQVHDELIFEVADAAVETAKNAITEQMQAVISLDVPLQVDIGIGDNWDVAH